MSEKKKKLKKELRAWTHHQEELVRLGQFALQTGSMDRLCEHAMEMIGGVLDVKFVKILEHRPEKKELFMKYGIGWKPGRVGNHSVPEGIYSQGGYTLLQKKPVICDRTDKEKHFVPPKLLLEHNIISGMTVVIQNDVQPYGILGVHSDTERHFTQAEAHFLESIANILAAAIQRIRIEEKIRVSQEHLRIITRSSRDAIIMMNPEGRISFWNPAAEHIFGFTEKEAMGEDLHKLLAPNRYIPKNYLNLSRMRMMDKNNEKNKGMELEAVCRDGRSITVELSLSTVELEDGMHAVGTIRDTTLHKKEQLELEKSRRQLKMFIDASPDMFFLKNEEKQYLLVNKATTDFFHLPEEDILFKTDEQIMPAELATFCKKSDVEALIEQKTIIRTEKNGEQIFETRKFPVITNGKLSGLAGIVRDITENKMAEIAIKEREQQFKTVVEQAADAIFVNDMDGNILLVNELASKNTGYSKEELLSLKVSQIAPYIEKEDHKHNIWDKLSPGETTVIESMHRRKDGSTFPVEVKLTHTSFNGKAAIIALTHNITERKKAEESMLRARMTAEEANRMKSQFLANMSHELRTPLNSIIGFSDVLDTETFGPLNEKQIQYIRNINTSGTLLLELINNLLDLSKIESGKMEIEYRQTIIADVINTVISLTSIAAKKKKIKVTSKVSLDINTIIADDTKLKEILYNLVDNAIKFTPEKGKVRICATIENKMLFISVKDTGIGISPENHERIFNPFIQADGSNKREYGGTGLGLMLVREYIKMHGGELQLESNPGEGTTFTFTIPVEPAISESRQHHDRK